MPNLLSPSLKLLLLISPLRLSTILKAEISINIENTAP